MNKETLAQVFSFEFCEIFKNTFFYRKPLVAVFVQFCKKQSLLNNISRLGKLLPDRQCQIRNTKKVYYFLI